MTNAALLPLPDPHEPETLSSPWDEAVVARLHFVLQFCPIAEASARAVPPPRQIACGIRLPPLREAGRPRKYRCAEMWVGDSSYVPEEWGRGRKPLEAARKGVQRQAKALPGQRRFAWRREGRGWRCWRVA